MEIKEIKTSLISDIKPERVDAGHKGTFGTALLVCGSKYMTGALILSAESALRSGCGMVRAFSEEEALLPLKINCPCALTSAYKDTLEATGKLALEYSSKSAATGIGSGIDVDSKTNYSILYHLISSSKKLLIDAGALTIIAKNKDVFIPLLKARVEAGLESAILTPHVGEFSRLLGVDLHGMSFDELTNLASDFAKETSTIVVLKSNNVFISDCGNNGYNYVGDNSGMAKGGSGDVLMGLITGFMAQGLSPINAAIAGTYFHQEAGKLAYKAIGKRAMLPSDLKDYLGQVFINHGW